MELQLFGVVVCTVVTLIPQLPLVLQRLLGLLLVKPFARLASTMRRWYSLHSRQHTPLCGISIGSRPQRMKILHAYSCARCALPSSLHYRGRLRACCNLSEFVCALRGEAREEVYIICYFLLRRLFPSQIKTIDADASYFTHVSAHSEQRNARHVSTFFFFC